MKFVALLCFVLSVIGCSNFNHTLGYVHNAPPAAPMPSVTPVWIDKDFSQGQRAAVHAAFSEWNMVLNGYQSFLIVSDSLDVASAEAERAVGMVSASDQGLFVLSVASEPDEPMTNAKNMEVDREGSTTLAYAYVGGHVMAIISNAIGSRDLKAITMHEVGHHLGLHHVMVKGTMLYPNYPFGSLCIDQVTVQALASIRPTLDWHHLNYCIRPL